MMEITMMTIVIMMMTMMATMPKVTQNLNGVGNLPGFHTEANINLTHVSADVLHKRLMM